MQITSTKGGLILTSKIAKVLVPYNTEVKTEGYDVVIGRQEPDTFCITTPGEYELKSVVLTALSSKLEQKVDVVEVVIEDINVLVVMEGFEYSKNIYDDLSSPAILVIQAKPDLKIVEMLNKFDPEIFVPMGTTADVEAMLKANNIANFRQESKLNLSAERFGGDDFVVETIVIA